MEPQESVQELEDRLRRLDEDYERREINKFYYLKTLMRLKNNRALDDLIDGEVLRLQKVELMRYRLLKREYHQRLHQIKLLRRELDRKRGIKQGGVSKKLSQAAPKVKTLVR